MATHSSILAWRIPWTEEPGWVTDHGVGKELDMTEQLTEYTHTSTHPYPKTSGTASKKESGKKVSGSQLSSSRWEIPDRSLFSLQ